MQTFIQVIQTLQVVLLVVVLLGVVFLFAMITQTNQKLNRLKRRYDLLLRGQEDLNLEEYMTIIGKTLNDHDQKLKALIQGVDQQEGALANALTKTGFVRYSAFTDEGAERSWSLALLDRNDNGVLITTIFGRGGTTTFAKEIQKGEASQELSEEERLALTEAVEEPFHVS